MATMENALTAMNMAHQRDFVARQSRNLMIEIAIMLSVTAVAFGLQLLGQYILVSYLVPITIMVVGAVANFAMISRDSDAALTPLFGIRMITMFMMGAGSLLHNFMPTEVQQSLDYMFVTTASDIARVDLLFIVGITALLIGSLAGVNVSARLKIKEAYPIRLNFLYGVLLFWLGFALSSVVIVTSAKIPGMLNDLFLALQLSGVFIVGREFKFRASHNFWVGVISIFLVMAGILSLNKTLAFYPLIAMLIGLISARTTIKRCLFAVVTIVALFWFLAPLVSYSRVETTNRFGQNSDVDISSRLAVVESYFASRDDPSEQAQTASRLDYIVPAAFVLDQYDIGMPSRNIVNSGFMFVPRIFWPEKPQTTSQGEVNYLMGSQGQNMIGVTVFADLYWNFGWSGLLLLLFVGLYFGAMTVVGRELLRRQDWIMLPFVLATFRMSLALDSEFMTSMIIPVLVNSGIFLTLRIISTTLMAAPRQETTASPVF